VILRYYATQLQHCIAATVAGAVAYFNKYLTSKKKEKPT